MKGFLGKFVFFTIIAILSICVFYIVKDSLVNFTPENKAIYLWGDSQMYLGIDPEYLSKLTEKPVYSLAQNGAGIYDFAVFAEKVPSNSTVVISISNMMLMKNLDGEYNRSGISFGALLNMIENKYTFSEIYYLLHLNKNESTKYFLKTEALPYTDTLISTESFDNFERLFKNEYPLKKEKAIFNIIKQLQAKGCRVNFISFPVDEKLSRLIFISPAKPYIFSFYLKIKDDRHIHFIDLTHLQGQRNLLYDVDHFNLYGRCLATRLLSNLLIN